MSVTVDLDNASGEEAVPDAASFSRWAQAALLADCGQETPMNLSIRLVGEAESASLNATYRQRQGPTNILSFPYQGPQFEEPPLLGDLAICVPVLRQEAVQQQKSEEAHWAHLTVHGVLHLRGHDHEEAQQAARMEALEVEILQRLGFADPYA